MMLHKFFEKGAWFAPKRLGYGAGLPIAWQGWVLVGSYIALVAGLTRALVAGAFPAQLLAMAGLVAATLVFLLIARKRTEGGWKWRG